VKSILKKVLFGIHHPREYISASAGAVSGGLDCFLRANGKEIPVSKEMLFLGYRPLLMGWIAEKCEDEKTVLEFRRKSDGAKMATLHLRLEKQFSLSEKTLFIFKGISSEQSFDSSFHRFMFRWYERFRSKPAGNIDLDQRLYNMVKIAYSIPREIKLVTLEDEKGRNIFPTDLHGKAGSKGYIISLRHDKKACQQVEQIGCLALWTISSKKAKDAYAMGCNHSKDLAAAITYPVTGESPLYGFPKPEGALSCCELELEKVIGDFGIHRLLLFKIVSGRGDDDNPERLIHLHRSYVQWHVKNGLTFTEAKR
jgi:hypothetical protein